MSTVATPCPESPAPEGSSRGKVLLDVNRSPVGGGAADSQNEDPVAAGTRASPVDVNLDRSLVAGGDVRQDEAPIAADTPDVVDLDQSLLVGGGGSQSEAPIAVGTHDSPIDVEALDDEVC